MQKELNPELFGTGAIGQTRFKETSIVSSSQMVHQFEQKMAEMNLQIKQTNDYIGNLVTQVNEYIKSTQNKFERINQSVKALETNQLNSNAEIGQKFSMVHLRLNEKKSTDSKVQELIDRHHSVLRSYEVRMSHLQKIISEKEAQLIQFQSMLNEAKMEIARLKRI